MLRPPPAGLARVAVCAVPGKLPGPYCGRREMTWFLPGVSPIGTCDVHRQVLVDRAGRRACGAAPGVHGETYEFWPSDLLRLFAEAGIPRRIPPPEAPGCRLDQLASRGVAPQITSPQEGVTYSLRAGRVGEDPIPLTAVTDADARDPPPARGTCPAQPGCSSLSMGHSRGRLDMPENARIHRSCSRHVCSECMRPALYGTHRGGRSPRARTDHPLCARCWRALLDHYRPAPPARCWLPDELLARVLAGAASPHRATLAGAATLAA